MKKILVRDLRSNIEFTNIPPLPQLLLQGKFNNVINMHAGLTGWTVLFLPFFSSSLYWDDLVCMVVVVFLDISLHLFFRPIILRQCCRFRYILFYLTLLLCVCAFVWMKTTTTTRSLKLSKKILPENKKVEIEILKKKFRWILWTLAYWPHQYLAHFEHCLFHIRILTLF